tara:strand:- start:285 stop:464 length:180 start_codon:yes stop_codon:yes gene_type:complete
MVEFYNFRAIREAILEKKNKLTLEEIVRSDMMESGYNPVDVKDIYNFWQDLEEDKKEDE